jgi:hypothetical protein
MYTYVHVSPKPHHPRRPAVSRPQPGRGAAHDLPKRRRLRVLHRNRGRDAPDPTDADLRLLRDAKPLAHGALAGARRGSFGVHATSDQPARQTLEAGPRRNRPGAPLPGPLQVVSDPDGRLFSHRRPLRGTQPAAGEPRRPDPANYPDLLAGTFFRTRVSGNRPGVATCR